jgi:hypothetical protein
MRGGKALVMAVAIDDESMGFQIEEPFFHPDAEALPSSKFSACCWEIPAQVGEASSLGALSIELRERIMLPTGIEPATTRLEGERVYASQVRARGRAPLSSTVNRFRADEHVAARCAVNDVRLKAFEPDIEALGQPLLHLLVVLDCLQTELALREIE